MGLGLNKPLVIDVLILANQGYSTAEIAKKLNCTEAEVIRILKRS